MQSPRMINVRKCCTRKEKELAKRLFMEYQDVFAWSYEDLMSFLGGKIEHQFPLKPEAAPF